MANHAITTSLGGETAALYQILDWSQTPLGAMENWPDPLMFMVNSMLCNPFPMYLCWGPDRILLYNDAYRQIISKKHPRALGQRFECVWPELWDQLEPLFQSIANCQNYFINDRPLVIDRHGYSEETFFTFSFSPIADGEGRPVGLQCICFETTTKVLADRSIQKFKMESENARLKAEQATEELERFVKQAPIGIAQLQGPDHIFKFTNKVYEKVGGKRDYIGLTAREVFPDLVGQPFFDLLDRVYRTGEDFLANEAPISFQRKDGVYETAYLDFIYAARFDALGQVEGISVTAVDVTPKVLAMRAVEQSEYELNQLANSMPQIVWTADGVGKVDYFNNRWTEYTGLGRGREEFDNWRNVIHREDILRVDEKWRNACRTLQPFLAEARLRNGITGEYKWFRIHGVVLRQSEGGAKKWYGSFTDIHDLRVLADQLTLAKSDLEEEKKKFEIIFENATSAMALVKEPQHIFEKANPAFRALFCGRIVLGQNVQTIFPELKSKNFLTMLDNVFATGTPYKSIEEKIILKSVANAGIDRRYMDVSFIQLKNKQGEVQGVLIDLIDVTERVIARRRLEESEEKFQLATKAAKIGIWDLNAKNHEMVLSERAADIFGLPADHAFPLEWAIQKIHPEDRDGVRKALEVARDPAGTGVYETTHRLMMEDGAVRSVSLFGQLRGGSKHSKSGDQLTGAILDITEDVTNQNELVLARQAAEDANAAKSAFLANMSHEIRSPLGAIMGFVELLKDEQIPRENAADYLGVIERNSNQLLRIIDDILDLSKVEAGKMLVEHIDFSLLEALADFASLMGFRAREKGIDFILRADTSLPDPINSDPTRIRQVLTNVVGNAIKFTKKGVVELIVSYHAPLLRFVVKDSGVGISTAEVSRLFQAFGQADASTTRKFGGTGLGLVLTKRLAQALGGDFWLEKSELGVGSSFIAEIAIQTLEESRMIQGSHFKFTTNPLRSQLQEPSLLIGKNILVVEDSPDNQMLLRVLLKRHGAKVEIAEDGLIGVEKALAGDYDVILMDVQMPRMDGYEAVRLLREKHYSKPIIALTAHAMIEEREKCLNAGYTDFLSKPIDRVKLLDALKLQLNLS